MKSSMAESFSRDSAAPGGGPSAGVAADEMAARQATAAIAANRLAHERNDAVSRGNISYLTRQLKPGHVMALPQPNPAGADFSCNNRDRAHQEYGLISL